MTIADVKAAADAIRRELARMNLEWIAEDVKDLGGSHDLTPYMVLAAAALTKDSNMIDDILERLSHILERLAWPTGQVWVGKDYSLRELREDLEKVQRDLLNVDDL